MNKYFFTIGPRKFLRQGIFFVRAKNDNSSRQVPTFLLQTSNKLGYASDSGFAFFDLRFDNIAVFQKVNLREVFKCSYNNYIRGYLFFYFEKVVDCGSA